MKNPDSTTTLSNLIDESAIAKKYNLTRGSYIKDKLAKYGIKPVAMVPFGKMVRRLYNLDDVNRLFPIGMAKDQAEKEVKEQAKAEAAKRMDVVAPIAAPASDSSLQLDTLTKHIGVLDEMLDALTDKVNKLLDQNQLIFRKIESVCEQGAVISSKLDLAPVAPMQAAVVNAQTDSSPSVQQIEPVKPAPTLPVIGVIGLIGGQRDVIKREFGSVFDLRFWTADEIRGIHLSSLQGCKHAMVMIRFINHQTENKVKEANVPYTRVLGGISTLRDRLTEFFVEDAKVAA